MLSVAIAVVHARLVFDSWLTPSGSTQVATYGAIGIIVVARRTGAAIVAEAVHAVMLVRFAIPRFQTGVAVHSNLATVWAAQWCSVGAIPITVFTWITEATVVTE